MKKPRYRHAGNSALLMEFRDEPSQALSLYIMALSQHMARQADPRFLGYGTCGTTLLVEYDPQTITASKVAACCDGWMASLPPLDSILIASRLVDIPVHYNDRWTRACAEDYARTVTEMAPDFDFLVKANGCADADELIARHSSPLWWVAGVDFPGSPFLKPCGAQNRFVAPRYAIPRMQTPAGTVVLGDVFTMIYPTTTPDGHRMLGRTPISFYDPGLYASPHLDPSLITLRTGDRVRFRPISEDEFLAIEASVAAGSYHLRISDEREITYAEFLAGVTHG